MYSGVAAISRAFEKKGHAACPYDIINDENGQNMNSDMGFLNAVNLIMIVWFAIVCSTWVWISISSDFEVENDTWDDANLGTLTASLHIPRERLGF